MEEFVHQGKGQLIVESLRISRFYEHQEEKEQQLHAWCDQVLNAIK
jgi:hypothetical protein